MKHTLNELRTSFSGLEVTWPDRMSAGAHSKYNGICLN